MSGIEFTSSGRPVRQLTKLTTTNATAVYTVDTATKAAQANTLILCNVDGTSAVEATVEIYDKAANVSYRLRSTGSVAADSFHEVDLHGIPLYSEDEIRVTAGAADDLHVTYIGVESGR